MTAEFTEHQLLKCKDGQVSWSEKYIQDLIADKPEILGLGEFVNIVREKIQPSRGRVDLILSGDAQSTRYVVEIQLGETNPSHIVRTIEYWDLERKARPDLDHVAVLVAEDISGRFHNVISLFNESIPLIAIKMTVVEIAGKTSVVFTRVVDISPHNRRRLMDAEAAAPAEGPGEGLPPGSSEAMRSLLEQLRLIAKDTFPNQPIEPHLTYTSVKDGNWNVISFLPRKTQMRIVLHIGQTADMDNLLSVGGLDYTFQALKGRYLLYVTPETFESQREALRKAFVHTAKVWGELAE